MPGLPKRSLSFRASAALIALAGIVLVYFGPFDTGLYYDDFHFVRPLSAAELRSVWSGNWDPSGIEMPFYRPLAASLFAFRFWLFGINTQAMHAISLVTHGLCAVLTGWFLRRERVSPALALFAVWLYAIHPLFPYSQASWLTYQMHLVESVLVLSALLAWQTVRDRALVWWSVLVPIAVAGFLVKEDAVLLLPVIVLLTALRDALWGERRWRRWSVLAGSVALLLVALVLFRHAQLGRWFGGYGRPTLVEAIRHVLKGPATAFLFWPPLSVWAMVGACLSTGATLIGLGVAVARRDRHALLIIGAGLIIAFGFNLPYALVSRPEQYHLLGLGTVVVLTGAAMAADAVARSHRLARLAAVVLTVPFLVLARAQAADFQPCSERARFFNREASRWWIVPTEITDWAAQKDQACQTGASMSPLLDLPVITWGLFPDEAPCVLLVRRDASSLSFAVRRRDASPAAPVSVHVRGGVQPITVVLDSDDWRTVTVPLSPGLLTTLRQSHRIDIDVNPPSPVQLRINH